MQNQAGQSHREKAQRVWSILSSSWLAWGVLLAVIYLHALDRRGIEGGGNYSLKRVHPVAEPGEIMLPENHLQVVSSSITRDSHTFRIGTFNIHSGKGRDEITDLDRTIESIPRDLDVLFLQEVRGELPGIRNCQVDQIGEAICMESLFLPVEEQWYCPHFGNALLTRRSHSLVSIIPLPCTQGKAYRNCVLSRFEVDGVTVNMLGTHVDLLADHDQQLEMVLSIFDSLAAPKILLGDLNSKEDNEEIALFLKRSNCQNVFAGDQHGRDWIITKGLHVVQKRLVDKGTSDHALLWTELSVTKPREVIATKGGSSIR